MSSETFEVDVRSDTFTKPTKEMRKVMAEAEVGDDCYGEDPTVNRLESMAADMFGKEAALFVASGTMANLISILCYCWERGSEVILGDQSHMYLSQQTGISQFGSVAIKSISNLPDGTLDLDDVRKAFRTDDNKHWAKTSVVAIENTISGIALPLSFMSEVFEFDNKLQIAVRDLANELKIPVYLDGARVFNAAVALNVTVKEIAQYADTLSICLSKSLGAPFGSLIIGSKEFIKRARRVRKSLGGGMRQAGILAAAGIIAITETPKRLHTDHENCLRFAMALQEMGSNIFELNLNNVQTNIVMFSVNAEVFANTGSSKTPAEQFYSLVSEPTEANATHLKMCFHTPTILRAVFHWAITKEHVDAAIEKFRWTVKQLKKRLEYNA